MPRDFEITDARHGAAFGVRVVTDADAVATSSPDSSRRTKWPSLACFRMARCRFT